MYWFRLALTLTFYVSIYIIWLYIHTVCIGISNIYYTDIRSVSAGPVGPVGPPLPLPLPVVPSVGPPIHIPGGNHLGMMYTCCYDI